MPLVLMCIFASWAMIIIALTSVEHINACGCSVGGLLGDIDASAARNKCHCLAESFPIDFGDYVVIDSPGDTPRSKYHWCAAVFMKSGLQIPNKFISLDMHSPSFPRKGREDGGGGIIMCIEPELFGHGVALHIKLFVEIELVPAKVYVLMSIHVLHGNIKWELGDHMPNAFDKVPVLCRGVHVPIGVKAPFKGIIIVTTYNDASGSDIVERT